MLQSSTRRTDVNSRTGGIGKTCCTNRAWPPETARQNQRSFPPQPFDPNVTQTRSSKVEVGRGESASRLQREPCWTLAFPLFATGIPESRFDAPNWLVAGLEQCTEFFRSRLFALPVSIPRSGRAFVPTLCFQPLAMDKCAVCDSKGLRPTVPCRAFMVYFWRAAPLGSLCSVEHAPPPPPTPTLLSVRAPEADPPQFLPCIAEFFPSNWGLGCKLGAAMHEDVQQRPRCKSASAVTDSGLQECKGQNSLADPTSDPVRTQYTTGGGGLPVRPDPPPPFWTPQQILVSTWLELATWVPTAPGIFF